MIPDPALGEHFELVVGGHVGQHDEGRCGGGGGHAHAPILEHVDADMVGGALVHVGVVFARPGERFVVRALDAGEGNAVVFQHVQVFLREIAADDAYQLDRPTEERRGQGGVGRGAA